MTFRLLALLTLAGFDPLVAADYYLSPTGSDASPGTLAQPWKTFAHAIPLLTPGNTLILRAGSYPERLLISGKSATAGSPIIIRNYPDEAAAIDGTTLTVPAGGRAGLISIKDSSHIRLSGLEVKNFTTDNAARIPVGIQIEGSGTGVRITDCHVHHIHQNGTKTTRTVNGVTTIITPNGFGISVYGTSSNPIDSLVLDSNEVHDLRTGQSESVVLNGNVTNFAVTNNHVHHCNNIGIDFIGYEGSAPAAVDRARDGICRGNSVHHIDSAFNPSYGGEFIAGGGDRSAAGIYIDGGTNITVDRNHVHSSNFGLELACENPGGFTDHILLLDNLLHHNLGPGLIMGGYDSDRGKTRHCQIYNNTLVLNDTLRTYGGQIALQFHLEGNTFKNNIIWAEPKTKLMVAHYVEGGTSAKRAFPSGNVFDYNLYFCSGDADDIAFGLNPTGRGGNQGNKTLNGLAAWRTAVGGDTQSIFANPGFVIAAPTVTAPPANFKLSSTSPAVDSGEPSPPYIPAKGETDYFGASRVANTKVDIGFHEFIVKPGK
jgi:hypothetical protein